MALDAYYNGYSERAEVTEGTLLLVPHLYNLAACRRAANKGDGTSKMTEPAMTEDHPGQPPTLTLDTPLSGWHLSVRSEKELLTFMMEIYGAAYARNLPSVESYVSLAEAAATRLSSAK